MGVFKDLELEWLGSVYTIKAHKVMGAISRIEEIVTLPELQVYAQRKTAPLAKLSMAFGSVLRYAGANVTDDEIYATAISQGASPEGSVMTAVMSVMQIMIPPEAMRKLEATPLDGEGGEPSKNQQATVAQGVKVSSKQRTKRRSQGVNG